MIFPIETSCVLAWLYLPITILLLCTLLLVIYKHRYTKYKLRHLPTVTWRPRFVNYQPTNLQDSTKMASSSITGILPRMQRLNGPFGMYGTVYGLSTAVVHIAHPVPAKAVLAGRSSKQPAYNHFQNFSGNGVFTADGEEWREKRASLIHCLLRGINNPNSQASLRLDREANQAAEQVMNGLSEKKSVNIVPILQRATIGLIYRLITHDSEGADISLVHLSSPNLSLLPKSRVPPKKSTSSLFLQTYLTSVTHIRMIILAQSRSFWFLLPRWIYRTFSAMYQEEERTMVPIRAFAQHAIDSAKPSSPLAMLRDRPSHSTSKDMLDEAITLLFAGQDTSAATLSWTLHLLSLYPEIQDRVAAEVMGSDVDLTKKDVSKWAYMDAVIKEAMRLYPVAPFVVRTLSQDVTINDDVASVTLSKDTLACVWIYSLHRNPTVWDRPNDFYPDRWLDDTRHTLGAYMPFAAGPRNCVGQPLAQVVLRIVLARLIRRHRFVDDRLKNGMNPQDLLKDMQAGFTVLPQGGVNLRVEGR